LQFFRQGRPIRARPVGASGRAWRWCRRNPVVAGLLTALVAVFLTGFAATLWEWREADREAEEKGRQWQRAEAGWQRARDEGDETERKRAEAVRERNEKEIARQQAVTALEKERRQHYFTRIGAANEKWRNNHVTLADDLLDACPWDLRGWEWGYLEHLCHGSRLTLYGHRGPVRAVAFSPDGKRLATAGEDGAIRLWDVARGRIDRVLAGHPGGRVHCLAFDPDGKRLASGSRERHRDDRGRWVDSSHGAVKVWDLATGKATFTLTAGALDVFSVAFSPDGSELAASDDSDIQFYNPATGKMTRRLTGAARPVCGLAFAADGKRLATAHGWPYGMHPETPDVPGFVTLWDLKRANPP
jgi:hypothetical protein